MSSNLPKIDLKNPIQGAGLTKPGIILLQFFLIAFIAMIEIFIRSKVGIFTGVAIWGAYFGGIRLGRTGTLFVAVVNPPIAFALAIFIWMPTIGGSSLRLSRLAIDLIASLASIAPFLLSGALISWVIYLQKRKRALLSSRA